MNDQELIRKAVRETAKEHDIEKIGGLIRGVASVARAVPAIGRGIKSTFTGVKQGLTGKAPSVKPKPKQPTAASDNIKYRSSRLQQQHAANQPQPSKNITDQWRTSSGRTAGYNAPTRAQKFGTGVRQTGANIKANPTGTPAVRRSAAKWGGRGAAVATIGAIGHQALKDNKANQGNNNNNKAGGTGSGSGGGNQAGSGGVWTGSESQKDNASRFMGRTGGSGHARQMQEGYKPQQTWKKMLKEYINNATSPQLASSMPTTASEMPASVFNDSMAEINAKDLPQVSMKIDEKDADTEKVTEAVMNKLVKQDAPDAGAEARQIGQSLVDTVVYNPSIMNLGRGEKKLQRKLSDMKFDAQGMPIDPKTGQAMSEKQMQSLYGKATQSQQMQQARGLGREVLSQEQMQRPPALQQLLKRI